VFDVVERKEEPAPASQVSPDRGPKPAPLAGVNVSTVTQTNAVLPSIFFCAQKPEGHTHQGETLRSRSAHEATDPKLQAA
jgi:hypothetical protein